MFKSIITSKIVWSNIHLSLVARIINHTLRFSDGFKKHFHYFSDVLFFNKKSRYNKAWPAIPFFTSFIRRLLLKFNFPSVILIYFSSDQSSSLLSRLETWKTRVENRNFRESSLEVRGSRRYCTFLWYFEAFISRVPK